MSFMLDPFRHNISHEKCGSQSCCLQEISARFAGNFEFQILLPGRKTFFLALHILLKTVYYIYATIQPRRCLREQNIMFIIRPLLE